MSLEERRLNKSELAQLLHCSERSLERMVARGELMHPIRLGRQAFWFESAIDKYLGFQRERQLAWIPRSERATRPKAPKSVAGNRVVLMAGVKGKETARPN